MQNSNATTNAIMIASTAANVKLAMYAQSSCCPSRRSCRSVLSPQPRTVAPPVARACDVVVSGGVAADAEAAAWHSNREAEAATRTSSAANRGQREAEAATRTSSAANRGHREAEAATRTSSAANRGHRLQHVSARVAPNDAETQKGCKTQRRLAR
jgi:hypothetical protein